MDGQRVQRAHVDTEGAPVDALVHVDGHRDVDPGVHGSHGLPLAQVGVAAQGLAGVRADVGVRVLGGRGERGGYLGVVRREVPKGPDGRPAHVQVRVAGGGGEGSGGQLGGRGGESLRGGLADLPLPLLYGLGGQGGGPRRTAGLGQRGERGGGHGGVRVGGQFGQCARAARVAEGAQATGDRDAHLGRGIGGGGVQRGYRVQRDQPVHRLGPYPRVRVGQVALG